MRAALFKPKARLMVKVVVAVALAAFNLNQRHSFFFDFDFNFFFGRCFYCFSVCVGCVLKPVGNAFVEKTIGRPLQPLQGFHPANV